MKPLGATDAKRLAREWRRRTEGELALLLDHVQTPYNVGAIARTAAALRAGRLYLVGATPPPSHPAARKTGLGTERFLLWHHFDAVDEAADAAVADGFRLVGVELTASARPLHELDLGAPLCLALGHEDRGLSPACLARCTAVGYVPLPGKVGSLNVATAASVALYEARRQEWIGGDR